MIKVEQVSVETFVPVKHQTIRTRIQEYLKRCRNSLFKNKRPGSADSQKSLISTTFLAVKSREYCLAVLFFAFILCFIAGIATGILFIVMTTDGDEVTLSFPGNFTWQLLFDIDYQEEPDPSHIKKRYYESVEYSVHDMENFVMGSKEAYYAGVAMHSEASALFTIANISIPRRASNITVSGLYNRLFRNNLECKYRTKRMYTYDAGKDSPSKHYQLVYKGPGLTYKTQFISTTRYSVPDVQLQITLKKTEMLKEILVKYGPHPPENAIQDINGLSADINDGFHPGEKVYLIPKWTKKLSKGATDIEILVDNKPNKHYRDIVKGAVGGPRYVKLTRDLKKPGKITKIALHRAEKAVESGPEWEERTIDVNKGRRGDYVWLVYSKNPRTSEENKAKFPICKF